MMKIGRDISTDYLIVRVFTKTKTKETEFGSKYACTIKVDKRNHVSKEEAIHKVKERD